MSIVKRRPESAESKSITVTDHTAALMTHARRTSSALARQRGEVRGGAADEPGWDLLAHTIECAEDKKS